MVKVIDTVVTAMKQQRKAYSDFLDPIKSGKFYDLLLRERGINTRIFGGYAQAERKMLGICPDYMELTDEEFPIKVLTVSYNSRYSRRLTHRDFLGSIMGLGIDRSHVGDIVVDEGAARVFLCDEVSGYIVTNLEKVGAVKVTVAEGAEDKDYTEAGHELRFTVASLRLDAIISAAFHISRGKASSFIEGEKVFVNWRMMNAPSKQIVENDVITVRGLGRIKLLEVAGKTKKDRLVIKINSYTR